MKKIVVLSGAGISAESGIKTFRDADGLWEGHDVMEVASPQGWKDNPNLVNEFYNLRRRELKQVQPNSAHIDIAKLESKYKLMIITQNVDNLHERAGSRHVIHLHGSLTEIKNQGSPTKVINWDKDLTIEDTDEKGVPYRPNIVWFGEEVPLMDKAIHEVSSADYVIIIGTSMQVYPAASLVSYADPDAEIYYIDPKPNVSSEILALKKINIIESVATVGMAEMMRLLKIY